MDDLTTLTLILSGGLSLVSLAISLYVYRAGSREQRYADLDTLYLELLRIGIDHPRFRDPQYTHDYKKMFKDEDERHAYECYAFIAWNICETIFDHRDSPLFETWKPNLLAENNLHRKWFDDPQNQNKFKLKFRTYVAENLPADDANAQ